MLLVASSVGSGQSSSSVRVAVGVVEADVVEADVEDITGVVESLVVLD